MKFIAGISAAVWPLAVRAQQAQPVRRVGYGATSMRNLLRDDLEQLGWSEHRSLQLDFRFGDGDARKTSAFAADLGA
jgi:hypothetical protein